MTPRPRQNRTLHNGRTNPLHLSAPLAEDEQFDEADISGFPGPEELRQELARASAELMWALHRQRQAWSKMARLKAEYNGKPNYEFLDNERPWKLAVGDVQWWRGEVSSRANAVQALVSLGRLLALPLGPEWAEVTGPGDTRRTFIRRGRL